MANSFNISVKPEIAAAVVKIDANKAVLDAIRATDLPGLDTKIDYVGNIIVDLHDTDLPGAVTKIDNNKTVIDDLHDTDLPGAVTKIDDNKAVIDLLSGAVNNVYPSDDVLHSNISEKYNNSATYQKVKETIVNANGFIRILFDLWTTETGTVYGKIYINGVSVGTERSQADNGATTYTQDLKIKRGDAVQIFAKHSDFGRLSHVSNFILKGVLTQSFTSIL